MHISLIRFALVAPLGDIGSEATPPIGLAYLSAVAKKKGGYSHRDRCLWYEFKQII